MRRKLKDAFNGCVRKSRKVVATLTASFALATGMGAPPASAQEQPPQASILTSGTTYWKSADYDITGEIKPCAEKGLCMSIRNINPKDPNVKRLLAELENVRDEPDENGFRALAPERVSDFNVLMFCGYDIESQLQQDPDGTWKGKIHSPFDGGNYKFRAAPQEDGSLKFSGYVSWLPFPVVTFKVRQTDAPPPECHVFQDLPELPELPVPPPPPTPFSPPPNMNMG